MLHLMVTQILCIVCEINFYHFVWLVIGSVMLLLLLQLLHCTGIAIGR